MWLSAVCANACFSNHNLTPGEHVELTAFGVIAVSNNMQQRTQEMTRVCPVKIVSYHERNYY